MYKRTYLRIARASRLSQGVRLTSENNGNSDLPTSSRIVGTHFPYEEALFPGRDPNPITEMGTKGRLAGSSGALDQDHVITQLPETDQNIGMSNSAI